MVRLRGGNSAREGRVELIINEKWVAVSHYYWNRNGADVVCKQLGYVNGAEEVVTTNRYHRHFFITFLVNTFYFVYRYFITYILLRTL